MERRRLVAVVALAVAVGAMVLLAAALPGLELASGGSFRLPGFLPMSPYMPSSSIASGEFWTALFRAMMAIFVVLLPFSLIYFLVSPEARRRVLRDLVGFISMALILYAFMQVMKVGEGMGLTIPGGAGAVELGDMPGEEFLASPPSWLIFVTSLALAVIVVVLLAALLARLAQPRPPVGGVLHPLGDEAERALHVLQNGGDLKDTIIRCYVEMSRVVREERGLQRQEAMTVREFEHKLVGAGLPRAQVRRLTRLFEDVRYGGALPGSREEREAVECLSSIVANCRRTAP